MFWRCMLDGLPRGLLAALALAAAAPSAAAQCAFPAPPTVLRAEADVLLQFWVLPDRPALHEATLPHSPALSEFRERISTRMDTEPRGLLAQQLPHTQGGDAENVRRVLSGEVGAVRPMSCLEALLFATQAERTAGEGRPMHTSPTEFLSYLLQRGDTLKVWYYTVDQPGVGGLATLHEPLRADLAAGWSVLRNIHNHNFFLDREGVLGGVVPSATDVQYLRNMSATLGPLHVSITNGFHTLDLTPTELARLSGP
jgi:hypothetical protein